MKVSKKDIGERDKKFVAISTNGVAKIVAYLTALITGFSIILSNSLEVVRYFFPKTGIFVARIDNKDQIVLFNIGDVPIFVDGFEYNFNHLDDRITNQDAIGKQVPAGGTIIHSFAASIRKERNILKRSDMVEGESLIKLMDTQNTSARGYCISHTFFLSNDPSYQMFKRILGDDFFEVVAEFKINAFELTGGRELDSDEIKLPNNSFGRVLFAKSEEPCEPLS